MAIRKRMTRYERRAGRLPLALALLLPVAFTGTMWYFGFVRGTDANGEPLPTGAKVALGAGAALGAVFCCYFGYKLVRNPVYFAMHDEGFWYAPAGVSTGLIRWRDIMEVREVGVMSDTTGPMSKSPALAVVLRDPEEYIRRFPAVMAPLFRFNLERYGSPVLIPAADFRSDYAMIKSRMEEQIRHATPAQR